jgi:hypothetical protein
MVLTHEAARELLRERVCSVCTDRRSDGSCGISGGRVCAFDKHLDRIVAAIGKVKSDRIQDYVTAIRADVCAFCEGQDETGYCPHRTATECALDAYVVLVVEAIEGAREREKAASRPASGPAASQ